MPKLVKLETDANVSNYTPEAGNITTFFAEEDGAVKLKYKNSAGEIAELSGGGGGGGGAFDLVKVTEYTPAQEAFTGISAVTFSGFGVDEMSGEDFSVLNGTFSVENETEPDPLKRTFKYGSYYLYYYPDPDSMNGGSAWCISQNKSYGGYSAWLFYNTESALSNGTINWYNMMGSSTSTASVTTANYPGQPLSLKGQKATGYDPDSKVWIIRAEEVVLAGCYNSPVTGGLYVGIDGALAGNYVALSGEAAIPTGFTSNTSISGYTINQSHGAGSYPKAYCVFNQNYIEGDYAWWSGDIGVSASNPCWFSIEVPEAFIPGGIFLMNELTSPQNFKDAVFQGSNDGSTWTDLLTITDSPDTTGLKQEFNVSCNTAYKHFRMYFTASHAGGVSVQAFMIYKTAFVMEE